VDDYKCDCPNGFDEKENKADGFEHDCLPKICGSPPTVRHATIEKNSLIKDLMTKDGKIKFGHAQLRYNCDMGYTMDGSPYGSGSGEGTNNYFDLRCRASGDFSDAPTCMPVLCGELPGVLNSDYPAGELEYPEKATYTCHEGHTTTGGKSGAGKFTIQCEAFGGFGGKGGQGGTEGGDMKTCKAVTCGNVPEIGKATHLRTEIFFPGQQFATCANGYSTDGTKSAKKRKFEINCNSDGSITTDPALPSAEGFSLGVCVPIKCPASAIPSVAMGEVTNFKPKLVFGDSVNVLCKTGYSPSGEYSAEAADNSFDVPCLATGFWPEGDDVPKCHPNTCG
jgi:hypothetical protein